MSLGKDVAAFRKKALQDAKKLKTEVCLRLFRSVVMDTPVLEGTLRGAWQLSIGEPIPPVNEVEGSVSPDQVMQQVTMTLDASEFSDTLYFTNPLPYAYPIEYYGWSSVKAPQGMVRKNTIRFHGIVQQIAVGVKNGTI